MLHFGWLPLHRASHIPTRMPLPEQPAHGSGRSLRGSPFLHQNWHQIPGEATVCDTEFFTLYFSHGN